MTGVERTAGLTGIWHYGYDSVRNRISAQVNDSVLTTAFNEKNQLVSSAGGGTLKVRGTLNEPGTAKVNGHPARMLAGNVFEATIQATTGINTFSVEATDQSGNTTTKNYQVDLSATGATYTYDLNGNLTQKVEGADTWTYEWNAEHQLTRVLKNSLEQARFAYDPRRRRVEKVTGGTTRSYTYEGANVIRERSGVATLRHVHSFGIDDILASEDSGEALTFYHRDGLGSVAKTTSSAGTLTLQRQYDAWGNLVAGATSGGFAFTGREWDPETGLYYYRARYYDPKSGRFLVEDPMGVQAGPNLYGYVGGNPALYIDPHGLERLPFTWPPKVPVTPPLPSRFERPTCCDKDEVRDRMDRVIDFINGMGQGQEPAGGLAGEEMKESTCDPITGICTPFYGTLELFNPRLDDKNPCVRYCGIVHEWVHETANRQWNRNWSSAAINLYREYPAYLRELICLRSFVVPEGQ